MKFFVRFMIVSLVSLLLFACGTQDEDAGADTGEVEQSKLEVFTTLYALEYFASEIGGEFVNVTSIIPAGTDAHTYEPTSRTMVDIAESDLFIYNNLASEAYAGKIEDALENESVKIVEASVGLGMMDYTHEHSDGEDDHDDEDDHHHDDDDHDHDDEDDHHHDDDDHDHDHEDDHHHDDDDHDHDHEDDHHHDDDDHEEDDHDHEDDHNDDEDDHDDHNHADVDSHVWISPTLSIDLAENIKDALVDLLPEQKELFEANFADLVTRLETLDQSFQTMIEQQDNRSILVTHAAYGYWERDYGINQIAINGLSSSDEPSQQQLANILDAVGDSNIKHVLFEQNVQPRVATVIQEEAGLDALQLHNLEVLTDDDINDGEDYFTLMERNIETLELALSN